MKNFTMTLVICVPLLLCALTGCEMLGGGKKLPFNATLDIGGSLVFKEGFFEANRTYGATYRDEDGDLVGDITSLLFRTYIIKEQTQLDAIFSVYPNIDFEKDMIVMYAYTSVFGNRDYIITSITLDNANLKVDFKLSSGRSGYMDASAPQTRFLVLKMDKLDIDTVEFIRH